MFKDQFYKDLDQGKRGEQIVLNYLRSKGCQVEDVSDKPQDYHNGDILITLPTGEQRYIEVKNDTRIGSTGNILCEEEVYYKEGGYSKIGFMHNNYDIYAIISEDTRKIYFLDFAKLKAIYKRYGRQDIFDHPTQYSEGYLLEVCRAAQFGALLDKVSY